MIERRASLHLLAPPITPGKRRSRPDVTQCVRSQRRRNRQVLIGLQAEDFDFCPQRGNARVPPKVFGTSTRGCGLLDIISKGRFPGLEYCFVVELRKVHGLWPRSRNLALTIGSTDLPLERGGTRSLAGEH